MNEYLQISHKTLASKQASKQASKHVGYTSIAYGPVCPHGASPCPVGAKALAGQGLFCFYAKGRMSH